MTPPLRAPAPASTPAPDSPQESTEVQEARQAVYQAGCDRNAAEIKYQNVVKEHGADSNEAKAAKADLDRAQAKAESTQAELRKALKLSQGKKAGPAATARASTAKPAKPEANQGRSDSKAATASKEESGVRKILIEVQKVPLPLVRGEYIRLHSESQFLRTLDQDPERMEKLIKGILQDSQNHGESSRKIEIRHGDSERVLELLRKPLEKPR